MGGGKGGKGGKGRNNGKNNGNAMQVDTQNGVPTRPKQCHKCGKQGHIQKDCRQYDNTNVIQNNGSQKCPHCNKPNPNHTAEQCFSNPNGPNLKGNKNTGGNGNGNGPNNGNNGTQNKEKKSQQSYVGYIPEFVPSYKGDQIYCQICNSTDHAGSACTFPTPHLYNSTMVCRNCCLKGHTDADCRHPNPINCKICHKPGHKAETCRDASAEFYKQGSSIVRKDERFIWGSFHPNANVPGPKLNHENFKALKPQYELEWELKKIEQQQQQQNQLQQQGDEWELPPQLDQEWLASERQAVADKSIVIWPGQKEPLHFIPLRHANAVPAAITHSRPFKVTKPQSGSKSTSTSMGTAKKSQIMKWIPTVTRANIAPNLSSTNPQVGSLFHNLNMGGMSVETFEAVYQRMMEEAVSATQKRVRAHVDRSTRLYRKQNYNTRIQQLSLRIIENNVLSDKKLLEIQFAMGQGAQFWRDPKAMEALVKRERPVCYTCGKEGVICDAHLRQINPEVAYANDGVAVLQIPDYEDWGVFVVFECQCCNHEYNWVERLLPPGYVFEDQPATMPNSADSFQKSSFASA